MALYRYLAKYRSPDGRPLSRGGLDQPGVLASDPQDALRLAEAGLPAFVRSRLTGLQVVEFDRREGVIGPTYHKLMEV